MGKYIESTSLLLQEIFLSITFLSIVSCISKKQFINVADDGLNTLPKMYKEWVKLIYSVILKQLNEKNDLYLITINHFLYIIFFIG